MMGLSRRVLATVLISQLVAMPAYAQPQPSPQDKQKASELTKQAIAKVQAGELERGIELYLEAYELVPLPVLLSNVGATYQKLGKPVEALKYFCMYLDKEPTGTSASFATAQAKLIHIEQGNKDVTDETVCAPSPPPEPDTPVIETAPPATSVAPPPETPTTDRGKTMRLAGLGIGGAGLVGMGVGIYFGLQAKDISDRITNHDRTMMWPDNIQDLEKEGQAHETKQIIFMVAGGAMIATGVALYFIGRSRKGSETTATIVPTATPDSAGMAIVGGF